MQGFPLKTAVSLLLFYFLSNAVYAVNVKNSEQKIMQKLDSQTVEIASEHIRQNWYFNVQPSTQSRFLVMKNTQEWQDFWRDTLPAMDTPNWDKGDVAVFIFLGKDLPGGTEAKLIKLDYQSEQDSATLFWKLDQNLDAISVTAFQDIWAVFTLNPRSNPIFTKLNKVVKSY
ncbi:MAG: hypothetical protein Ctma_1485 [Catillopecten margaritatus gill symbiont]|uniref:Uncharacterized protein n=1 Tax=Catillopecten margaritatus gill symbiont TaxID=3083288 RepID=A0AAU6PIC6_9GAMM